MRELHRQERGPQVDGEGAMPLLDGHLEQRLHDLQPSVIDQRIDARQSREEGAERRPRITRAQVEGEVVRHARRRRIGQVDSGHHPAGRR